MGKKKNPRALFQPSKYRDDFVQIWEKIACLERKLGRMEKKLIKLMVNQRWIILIITGLLFSLVIKLWLLGV